MTGQPTRTKDETTGREILKYPDGTEKDARTGFFIRGPLDNPITRDPRGMLALRNSKSKRDARDAIDEEIYPLDPSKWGTGEGWKDIIRKCVSLIMQSKNSRGVAELVGKVGTAAGYLSANDRTTEIEPRGNGQIHATPEAIKALLILLDEEINSRLKATEVIDA